MKMIHQLHDFFTLGLSIEEKKVWRKWFFLSLGFHFFAAFFNIGYHQADEHFQVLEFASYKLGFTPEVDLAWEFENNMRPALQPLIAFVIGKAMISFNLYSPFTLAFILRLLAAGVNLLAGLMVIKNGISGLSHQEARTSFLWGSFILWFLPYLHSRFSGESFSAAFFAFGISSFLNKKESNQPMQSQSFFAAGLFFGFAFLFRYQMAFGILGFGLWMLICGRFSFMKWALMAFGFFVATGIGVMADVWFYGGFEPVAWNYFRINILEHKAAEFGVQPIWWYLTEFIATAAPPLSIALLGAVTLALWKSFRHPAVWAFLAFVIGHSAVGHKEMRFLFPVVHLLSIIAALGVDGLLSNENLHKKWENLKTTFLTKGLKITFVTLNGILLVISSFRPANETAPVYQAIYHEFQNLPKEKRVIYGYQATFYGNVGLNASFYKPEGLKIERVDSIENLAKLTLSGEEIWVVCEGRDRTNEFEEYGLQTMLFAQTIPEWMTVFNVNDWLSRTAMSRVYKIKSSQKN
ncbi:MAG: hypothetical protein SFU91_14230 [Chloroherpetonaceae bacterium]|nr:hypothetical protein [Chloroherpetonaceae bacterium]